jgi:uncharacterized protein YndB with AHSA1/START domain
MKLAVQELVVHAPIEQLFELLVDPELFVLWMADDATLDPVPGGVVRWTHPNGDCCSGTYVEVVRPHRVVFTYGWERAEVQIPPGSTTVEIDLTARPDGSTTSGSCTTASRTPRPTRTKAAGVTTSTGSDAPPKASTSARIRGPTDVSRRPGSSPGDSGIDARGARGPLLGARRAHARPGWRCSKKPSPSSPRSRRPRRLDPNRHPP